MRHIRKRDTRPELVVRRLVHGLGYRYRLYRRDLPGTPDLAFISRKKVIQVHGCFWHQHDCHLGRKQPRTNLDYWLPKLARNRARDVAAIRQLGEMGWSCLVIWECQVRDEVALASRITAFLQSPGDRLR